MLHPSAGLGQDVRNHRQRGFGLQVRVTVQVRRTRRCAGDKDLISDAHGARVAVGIFKRIPR
jgi:hypothetical protein